MKQLFLLSLLGLMFGFSQNLHAQTCNDPNAHNFGEIGACETCFDMVQNGDEEGVDCGGNNPNCPSCPITYRLDVEGNGSFNRGNASNSLTRILTIAGARNAGADSYADINFSNFDDVSASEYIGARISSYNVNGLERGDLRFNTYDGNSLTEKMRIEGDGDVFFFRGDASNSLTRTVTIAGARNLGSTPYAYIDFSNLDDNNSSTPYSGARISAFNEDGNEKGELRFATYDGTTLLRRMAIYANGNVGIGVFPPSCRLDVNGTVCSNGSPLISDRQFKHNIKSLSRVLEKINLLEGVSYQFRTEEFPERNFREGNHIGLIAQDLEQVFPELIFIREDGYKAIYYEGLIPVLIEGIKAQQSQIEEKEEKIEALVQENEDIKARLHKLETLLLGKTDNQQLNEQTTILTEAKLFPNQPNPFSDQTLIRYYIPEGSTNSEIRITNLEGKIIKVISIQATGEGQLTIHAPSHGAGTYLYSLIVNGELIATEKMIFTENK